jgi:hypothetical protein
MMSLDRHQVGLLQPGNEEQIPLYACLADVSRYVLTRNLRTSAYELYARNSVNRKLSMIYSGTLLMLAIIWVLLTVLPLPFPPFAIISIFFGWAILGQTTLNLLALMVSLLHTPQPETEAQRDNLPDHYKVTFSRKGRVHFLGVWFVTTSKTSVQAFTS